jgi:hypothetical protein
MRRRAAASWTLSGYIVVIYWLNRADSAIFGRFQRGRAAILP